MGDPFWEAAALWYEERQAGLGEALLVEYPNDSTQGNRLWNGWPQTGLNTRTTQPRTGEAPRTLARFTVERPAS